MNDQGIFYVLKTQLSRCYLRLIQSNIDCITFKDHTKRAGTPAKSQPE